MIAPGPGTNQSLHRGLLVLDFVIGAGVPVRLADIARHFGMDRAAAFRVLRTLEQVGLVAKDPERKSYTVGGKLLHWTIALGSEARIVQLARPSLQRLVEATGESGHFGVLSSEQALLLDFIGADGMVMVKNRVGVHEPLHCTALGKALLAWQPAERVQPILDRLVIARFTERTIGDRCALERVLEEVRATAQATDDGEYNEMLYCIASPVLAADGSAIGAIGISMLRPLAIQQPERIAGICRFVRREAGALSALIGSEAVAGRVFGPVGTPAEADAGSCLDTWCS